MELCQGMRVFRYRQPKVIGAVVAVTDGIATVNWPDEEQTQETAETAGEVVEPWRDIAVYPITLPFHNGRTYHRTELCCFCNADSLYRVRRVSGVSGRTYCDPVCEMHAESWRRAAAELQLRKAGT